MKKILLILFSFFMSVMISFAQCSPDSKISRVGIIILDNNNRVPVTLPDIIFININHKTIKATLGDEAGFKYYTSDIITPQIVKRAYVKIEQIPNFYPDTSPSLKTGAPSYKPFNGNNCGEVDFIFYYKAIYNLQVDCDAPKTFIINRNDRSFNRRPSFDIDSLIESDKITISTYYGDQVGNDSGYLYKYTYKVYENISNLNISVPQTVKDIKENIFNRRGAGPLEKSSFKPSDLKPIQFMLKNKT